MSSRQSGCEHEWEPFPEGLIVISDEEFYANPLKNFVPESIVPCLKCGAPIHRGRYDRYISIPALSNY